MPSSVFVYSIDMRVANFNKIGHPFEMFKHCCNCTTRSQFFTELVINVSNSLPCDIVDFSTLSAFKHCLEMVDLSKFCSLV